ncbi:prolipoprotein diacylglyceryl transferase [Bacillus kwashiorkori]|uniref:prolipoprotein diacylglyceryl transferase n=1 Tax=Bacillus kwashiorkori TaxID=1522318 RepID=UPI00078189D7|nr:prolipoprotein diacylglyceryl transferase [Bacillus kwashiorkori]
MIYNIQPLDPFLLKIGDGGIRWYGFLIGLGIVIAFLLVNREAKKRHLPEDTFADLLIWAIPLSIIGARIYYVLFRWDYYSMYPAQIFQIWEGGLAIHGALIVAIITAVIFSRKKNLSFWKLADIAAPSIIIAQAIGRWGNFMNQEAHGEEVTRGFLEGLHLPDFIINQMYIDGKYYHPTFLYESLWNILGFIILISFRKLNLKQGEIFFSYIIWYSIGRFFIEGMRTDSLMLGDFRVAQLLSLSVILLSVIFIVIRRKKGSVPNYLD